VSDCLRSYDGDCESGCSPTHTTFWTTLSSITSRNATRCGTRETSGQPRCWIVLEPSGRSVEFYGNVDGAELRADLPEDLVWECEGLNVYMTHIGGYPGNYDRRAGKEVRRLRPGLFICGHSHILKVMRDQALGLVHMNPGACGHNGWHIVRTLLRFTVEAGKISGVQAIEPGPRGQRQTVGNRSAR
jgi:hypothetical protein